MTTKIQIMMTRQRTSPDVIYVQAVCGPWWGDLLSVDPKQLGAARQAAVQSVADLCDRRGVSNPVTYLPVGVEQRAQEMKPGDDVKLTLLEGLEI